MDVRGRAPRGPFASRARVRAHGANPRVVMGALVELAHHRKQQLDDQRGQSGEVVVQPLPGGARGRHSRPKPAHHSGDQGFDERLLGREVVAQRRVVDARAAGDVAQPRPLEIPSPPHSSAAVKRASRREMSDGDIVTSTPPTTWLGVYLTQSRLPTRELREAARSARALAAASDTAPRGAVGAALRQVIGQVTNLSTTPGNPRSGSLRGPAAASTLVRPRTSQCA